MLITVLPKNAGESAGLQIALGGLSSPTDVRITDIVSLLIQGTAL